jgi:hypothetical protein
MWNWYSNVLEIARYQVELAMNLEGAMPEGESIQVYVDYSSIPTDATVKSWIEISKIELDTPNRWVKTGGILYIQVGGNRSEDARRLAIYGYYALDTAKSYLKADVNVGQPTILYGENNDSITIVITFQEE